MQCIALYTLIECAVLCTACLCACIKKVQLCGEKVIGLGALCASNFKKHLQKIKVLPKYKNMV